MVAHKGYPHGMAQSRQQGGQVEEPPVGPFQQIPLLGLAFREKVQLQCITFCRRSQ